MLISSKTKNEKIIIGLLSYTFPEGSGDMSEIRSLLDSYREDPNYDILLYKDKESDNFVGVLCVEADTVLSNKNETESTTLTIHRVAVIPSFRNEGVGYHIYELLRKKYPNATIIGGMTTVDLVTRWSQKYNALMDEEEASEE